MTDRAYDRILTLAWIALLLIAAIIVNVLGVSRAYAGGAQVVGSRPAGCPHRFCGCALSIRKFGRIIPRLNLAANWRGFPRAAPAPGMVAARPGHVFELVHHIGGSTWLVWDPNSGRGRTRIHPRSIAGYTIHNPHGYREARAR
jgi:hypothetical protein